MERYRVVIAESGKIDIINKKRYIIDNFKYREYAKHFTDSIKKAAKELEVFPEGFKDTGFRYRGYDIYLKPVNNHLLFYTINEVDKVVVVLRVLQDGMDWENIIRRWLQDYE